MSVEFWKKYQSTSSEDAKSMLQKSHAEAVKLAETFSNEELFSKGVYKWSHGSTLGQETLKNADFHSFCAIFLWKIMI